ncbi:DEHYDRATION-INDUCED 19 homolog 7-like protein [Drosera capensis]
MERGDHHWSHRASTTASSNSTFRRFQSSKSEVYLGGEDGEIEEECKQEFLCPFCGEEFDVVGLFCHIEEEHPVEVRNGVCPVCAKRVGMDMVYHITMQHGNILKISFLLLIFYGSLSVLSVLLRKRRSRKGASSAIFSLLKELRDVNLQSLLEGSSYPQFSSNSDLDIDQNPDPDPLLSSFIYSSPSTDGHGKGVPAEEASSPVETKSQNVAESNQRPQLSDKDEEEQARRSEFVQQTLLSTILDDIL